MATDKISRPPQVHKCSSLSSLSEGKKESILFYTIISPFLIMFVAIKLIPLLNGLYLSFTNYTGYNYNRIKFVGIQNYISVFTDNDAMYALLQTFKIGLVTVPLGLMVGLAIAVLLNKAVHGLNIFRTIVYLPSIIPAVATGLMWKSIFNRDSGILNYILGFLGVNKPINWLGYENVFWSLIIMLLWGSTGSLLINLAALKDIPVTLYEAASIDGANSAQKFFRITLPMITPVLFFNLIMGIIGALQMYTQPVLLAYGNNGVLNMPLKPIYTYMVHAYQQILGYARFGYGLSMIWVLVVIINLLTLVIFKTSRHWVFYSDGEA